MQKEIKRDIIIANIVFDCNLRRLILYVKSAIKMPHSKYESHENSLIEISLSSNELEELSDDYDIYIYIGDTNYNMRLINSIIINQNDLPKSHAPILGQHNREVLTELGINEKEITRMEAREKANKEMIEGMMLTDVANTIRD